MLYTPDYRETHSQTWGRVYEMRHGKGSSKYGNYSPIQLEGTSSLAIRDIPEKVRRKIDLSLKRGYMVDQTVMQYQLMDFLTRYNPINEIKIGYVLRKYMRLYLPDYKALTELRDLIAAQSAVTDELDASQLSVSSSPTRGYYVISKSWGWSKKNMLSQSHFKSARILIDEAIAEQKQYCEDKEAIRKWIANDDLVINVKFRG